jgi:hypothetical protein
MLFIARRAAFAFFSILGALLGLMALLPFAPADDQEKPRNRDAEERRATERLIQTELPRWKIATGAASRELKLEPKAVLRWTNPAIGRLFGELYVWTADGRPEIVMSLYEAWDPAWGFAAEMHSLAPEGVVERQTLRLLTNPVFRYSSRPQKIADGAIFAFVVGTDAEVLLLVESRAEKNKGRWQYALARLNRDELSASFHDREVWRVSGGVYGERDKPYFLIGLSETLP